MSSNREVLKVSDRGWPGWLVWAFVAVSLLTSIHWALYNNGRLTGGEPLLNADGVKYFVFLPSILLQGNLDFTDEILAVSSRAGGHLQSGRGPLSTTTPTGMVPNAFPVGSALLWSPFYLAAHAFVRGDGLDPLYQMTVLFGSLVYGIAALGLLIAILRRFFAAGIAFFASLLTWAGGFVYYYTVYRGDMSHAPSIFMTALVILLWLRIAERFHWRRAIPFGLAAGLMILVRPQNALILLVPLAHSAWILVRSNGWRDRRAWTGLAGAWAVVGVECLIVFLPQLLIWSVLYGQPSPAMASNFFQFGHPSIVEILFSRNGIISFTPLLGFALIGLFILLGRDKAFFLPCLLTVLLLILFYSVSGDWWCGDNSFGIRRLANATPLLALGMAASIAWMTGFFKRHAAVAAGLVLTPLLIWNFLSMQTVGEHKGEREFLSLTSAAGANLSRLRDALGWPLSLPGSLPFALIHGVAPGVYDAVTGRPVDRGVANLFTIPELLVEGWRASPEGDGQWTLEGSRARILFSVMVPGRFTGELRCIVRRTPPKGDLILTLALNGTDCGRKLIKSGRNYLTFRLPQGALKAGLNELVFKLLRAGEGGEVLEAGRVDNVHFKLVSLPKVVSPGEAEETDANEY
jgi:hypothetical protein